MDVDRINLKYIIKSNHTYILTYKLSNLLRQALCYATGDDVATYADIATPIGIPYIAYKAAVAADTANGVAGSDEVLEQKAGGGKFWLTPKGYGPSGHSVFDYNARA